MPLPIAHGLLGASIVAALKDEASPWSAPPCRRFVMRHSRLSNLSTFVESVLRGGEAPPAKAPTRRRTPRSSLARYVVTPFLSSTTSESPTRALSLIGLHVTLRPDLDQYNSGNGAME